MCIYIYIALSFSCIMPVCATCKMSLYKEKNTYIYIYMLESQFWYHVLAFREPGTVPPQELETVPPLEGTISALQKQRFLRIFVTDFGANLCFFFLISVFGPISDLLLLIHHLSKNFFGKEAKTIRIFFRHFFSPKHYKNSFCLLKGSSSQHHQKT